MATLPRRRRLLAGLLGLASPLLLGGCVQRLFFYPDQLTYTTPEQEQVQAEDVFFDAEDGSRLHGWWMPALATAAAGQAWRAGVPPSPTCTVVHAHGNAANISNHLPVVSWLPAMGVNVLMFDYRGYGRSAGQPTLDGVVSDIQSALRAAGRQPGVQADHLVMFGQSLGGASAIRAVQRSPAGTVRGLIVDSAFASYRGIGRHAAQQSRLLSALAPVLLPWLPPTADDPVQAIASLTVPVWIMHGQADLVIPFAHGHQLFVAASSPKQLLTVPDGGHIDALRRPEFRQRFLKALSDACGSPHIGPGPGQEATPSTASEVAPPDAR